MSAIGTPELESSETKLCGNHGASTAKPPSRAEHLLRGFHVGAGSRGQARSCTAFG